jgi:hypothetical protein
MALNLQAFVSLDGSGFESGLKRIEGAVHHVGESLKSMALAAVGIAGIESALHKTVDAADKLIDSANRLGIGVEKLGELKFAAEQSGASFEQLVEFIEKVNRARIDPKKVDYFGKLGISAADISSMQIPELISKLSENVRTRSPQDFGPPLLKIDKSAGPIIPMLRSDMAELAEEAQRLGAIMRTQDAVMLKFLADEFNVLSQIMVSNLAPAINFVIDRIAELVNRVKASGTFWGSFTSGKAAGGFAAIWDELTSGSIFNKRNAQQMQQAFDDIKQGFIDAGTESQSELIDLNEKFEGMKQALLDKQKLMEKIGAMPKFDEVGASAGEGRSEHFKIYSDEMTRIGSFLGATDKPMISIVSKHTNYLAQIAENTKPKPTGFDDVFPP